jgi:hypothetical protein
MATVAEIEQAFWSCVWRCSHRWPCTRCCWPWHTTDFRYGYSAWKSCGTYAFAGKYRLAYKVAYILASHTLILPGILVRHRCHFEPCCNPAHLRLGSIADNNRDNRGRKHHGVNTPAITLPNGYAIAPHTPAAEALNVSADYLLSGRLEPRRPLAELDDSHRMPTAVG